MVGITNQGGVAHGHKTTDGVMDEIEATIKLFSQNPFSIIKACCHMADGTVAPYNHRSLLRKPDIGMLAIAESELFQQGIIVDYDKSLFVGDRPEDEECAKNAGIDFEHIDSFLVSPKEFSI